MKKLISYFTVTYLMLTCFSSAYGQWNTSGIITNRYYETDNFPAFNNFRSVGVGNFSSFGFEPISALHVNTNFLDLSPNFPKGDVFMTTGPSTNLNAWRMFTGAGNGTERFSITVPANSNDVNLQVSQNGAKMLFNINGAGLLGGSTPITRMVITDGSFFGNTGLIGMGNGFLAPQSQLHLNDGVFSTYLQITNFATNASALNPAATDGFKLGIADDGTAEIRQQENLALKIFTNDTEQLVINETGNVIIHSLTCDNCIVTTTKTGQLQTKPIDVTQLVTQIDLLEQRIAQLEMLLAEK